MKRSAFCLTFVLLAVGLVANCVKIELENLPERCDFRKCTAPDPKRLNVHLIPHSHDDVGWLKSVDQYFYGSRSNIQKAGVQYTIDSVIEELIRDKDRRFIQVETAFFWMWWQEQGEEQRSIVRELVKSGQLEFIGGGWSMNDEATTTYLSTIDQMTWGHRRLVDTFGRCAVPKVAWQLDPFGHSKEMAALFAGMGFDALFFARQDYQDIAQRVKTNTLEHMWQASEELGTRGDLLTGMMKDHYGPLPGLRWDLVDNDDDPIVDNTDSEEYNLVRFLETFEKNANAYAVGYPTRNILIPMGEDFQYMAAHPFYKNMDKLIHWMAHSTKFKVFYSTPSCYAKALSDAANVTFASKTDDFFPYASDPHSYWTGYFTSRAALKLQERVGASILQTGKIVEVLSKPPHTFKRQLIALKEEMGIMQHHDAVAGTEKQHVSDDYSKRLTKAVSGVQQGIAQALRVLYNGTAVGGTFCPQLNASSCPITETAANFTVTLINPLAMELANQTVRFPVKEGVRYTVTDLATPSAKIPFAVVDIPEPVQKLAERKGGKSKVELVVRLPLIPPLSLVNLAVQEVVGKQEVSQKKTSAANAVLKGRHMSVHFDDKGAISKVTLADGTTSVSFKNEFHFYKGIEDRARNSGAYIFRPAEQKPTPAAHVVEATLHGTAEFTEVHQTFSVDWISQVVRLVPSVDGTEDVLEFEWIVGPIPVAVDHIGKELVTRYVTDLNSGNRFKTDANARQLLTRQVDFRPSWKLEVTEPVSGNYYPVNSMIVLEDAQKKLSMAVLVDRSQGGTSMAPGVAELMLHRRLLHDDGKGVGEPLSEPGVDGRGLVVRGRHQVVIAPT
ncbi:PREDICTED: lysosomal alpha-mannosidase-like, partial [Rhagoletis zephyria]|uniref:lysosomal alpha-mannosidase-like n=1 Tax=Rhagoletis zephyria TaxID=28612 RepID=UPI00081173EA